MEQSQDDLERNCETASRAADERLERIVDDLESCQDDDKLMRDILYNVIRSDDVELFENVMDKWRGSSDDLEIRGVMIGPMSEAFEELLIKNVHISEEMVCAVAETLIESQYFSQKDAKSEQEPDINARITMVCERIEMLQQKYSEEFDGQDVDEEFIFVARFVARNIRILKRELKSTYDKLPWEEIEFCLVAFISSETKQQELNFYYKLVLDKNRILKHLVTFVVKLSNLTITENKEKKKLGDRKSVVKSILEKSREFEGLYDDFEFIRNVYSLSRAERYINLAATVDLETNFELGKLVLERALQVIGECLKNTLESPNVSDDVLKMLLHSAPRNLRDIITLLRDSLSHAYYFERKLQIENANDFTFFKTLQNDIVKIGVEVRNIQNKKKSDAITVVVSKISKCDKMEDVEHLRRCFEKTSLDDADFQFECSSDLKKIQLLVDELRQVTVNPTAEVVQLFIEIDKIIEFNRVTVADCSKDYQEHLNYMFLTIYRFKTLQYIKNICRSFLSRMMSTKRSETNLYDIVQLLKEICKQTNAKGDAVHICYKIFCVIQYDERNVKTINDFKEILERKIDRGQRNREEIVDNLIEKIENCIETKSDKDTFRSEVKKLKEVYEIKQKLIVLFDHANKFDKEFSEEYDSLVGSINFSKSQKDKLDKFVKSSNWKECKKSINNARDGFKTFYDSITSQKEAKKFDLGKVIKDFVRLTLKNQDDCIELMLKEGENKNEGYFRDRLKLLNVIVPLTSLNRSRTVLGKFKKDCQLQAAVEMIVLDLMEMLEDASLLSDNSLFLDRPSPVIIGKQLRNYLAHGDALFDSMPLDPFMSLVSNAVKLIREGNQLITTKEQLVGQNYVEDINYIQERFANISTHISDKTKLFAASRMGDSETVSRIADSGVDLNARTARGQTALHLAVECDQIEVLKLLLTRNLVIDVKDGLEISAANGSTNALIHFLEMPLLDLNDSEQYRLLNAVAGNGHLDGMKVLLERGFLVRKDKTYLTPLLQVAILHDQPHVVELLLQNVESTVEFTDYDYRKLICPATLSGNVHTVNMLVQKMGEPESATESSYAMTPLQSASLFGHAELVKTFLSYGANANGDSAHGKDEWTPLHCAADSGCEAIIEALISSGATVDVQDDNGTTPLHLAVENGFYCAVDTLLHHQATVDLVNACGRTPLHIAARYGHVDVILLLLDRGAKCDIKDKYLLTPFCLAVLNRNSAAALLLVDHLTNVDEQNIYNRTPLCNAAMRGDVEIVSALLDRGALVNFKDDRNITPLHLAAVNGHPAVVELLLSKEETDRNVKATSKFATPLHLAASNGHLDVCQVLLKHHTKVDVRDDNDCTPLHLASEDGNQDIVKLLLDNKADVDSGNKFGITPLHLAVRNDHKIVVDVLVKKGKANVNVMDNKKKTPLLEAAGDGYADIMQTLLSSKDALPDLASVNNFVPLHLAALNGHKYAVLALLKAGANVNTCGMDNCNRTPLQIVAENDHSDVCQILLANNATVNVTDNTGCTPLHMAVNAGSCKVAKQLLANGADVEAKTNIQFTSLHLAAFFGKAEIALILLEHGANRESLNEKGLRPLHVAAQKDSVGVAKLLLDKGAEIDAENQDNWTALHLAAWHGHRQVAVVLLEGGANVNAVDGFNRTPLYFAAQKSHTDIANLLLENGASLKGLNETNVTLLHVAAKSSQTKLAELLLEKGADVNEPAVNGMTPLHFAVGEGNADLVDILLRKGAIIDLSTPNGFTPLHTAIETGHPDIALTLIARGASIHTRDVQQLTPLHVATRFNQVDVAVALVARGAEVDATGKGGVTALHIAAQFGHLDMSSKLLEIGALVNFVTMSGATALHVAAEIGQKLVAELLLDRSAAINAQESMSLTPLHVAALNGHTDVVQLLVERGADANIKGQNIKGHTPFYLAKNMLSAALIMSVTDTCNLPELKPCNVMLN